jgi:FkbH-like protein
LTRAQGYAHERQRQELATSFVDYDGYLRSLEMSARVENATAQSLARVAQLFGKTNQFNMRTQRYSEGALAQLMRMPDAAVLHVRFADRFSDYGVVGAVVIKVLGNSAFIDNWVMSCRVFERGLEDATLDAILRFAISRKLAMITGEFIPTEKNGYVKDLFGRLGFEPRCADDDVCPTNGGALFALQVAGAAPRRNYIDTTFDIGQEDAAGMVGDASEERHAP